MTPNIDRKGRIARAATGSLCIALGLSLWLIEWPAGITARWILTAVAVAAGAFQLFEARKAWCICRACGFKTPM